MAADFSGGRETAAWRERVSAESNRSREMIRKRMAKTRNEFFEMASGIPQRNFHQTRDLGRPLGENPEIIDAGAKDFRVDGVNIHAAANIAEHQHGEFPAEVFAEFI